MMNSVSKGFSLTFPNGCQLAIERSVINRKQKSYDVLFNDGTNNCWYKIGLIKDIDTLRKILK